jgi:hypothetical protein
VDHSNASNNDASLVSNAVRVSEGAPYNGRPRTQLALTIHPEEWEDVSENRPPGSRLAWTGSLTIAGAGLMVEAWEVHEDANHVQRSIAYPDDLDHLAAIYETAFGTVTINDREYVIVALPSSA